MPRGVFLKWDTLDFRGPSELNKTHKVLISYFDMTVTDKLEFTDTIGKSYARSLCDAQRIYFALEIKST